MLAGNHVLRAARDLGFSEIAATFVDLSEEEALKLVLVDNRTSDLAGYDDELLIELLSGLGDLSGTGFDEAALDDLLDEVPPLRGGGDPAGAPRAKDPPRRPLPTRLPSPFVRRRHGQERPRAPHDRR